MHPDGRRGRRAVARGRGRSSPRRRQDLETSCCRRSAELGRAPRDLRAHVLRAAARGDRGRDTRRRDKSWATNAFAESLPALRRQRNPSRTRTLNSPERRSFRISCRGTCRRRQRRGLAVDVARIERAMEDVFDAPRAEPMTAAEFAAIGQRKRRARLRVNPALRLLKLRYPGERLHECGSAAAKKPRLPRPRETLVIVYRRDFRCSVATRSRGSSGCCRRSWPAGRSQPRCARASDRARRAPIASRNARRVVRGMGRRQLFVKGPLDLSE